MTTAKDLSGTSPPGEGGEITMARGKLARLGIRPIRHALRQGEVAGRCYQIPLGRFRWDLKRVGLRAPGRRVAVRSMA